jgi:hypothetical protein
LQTERAVQRQHGACARAGAAHVEHEIVTVEGDHGGFEQLGGRLFVVLRLVGPGARLCDDERQHCEAQGEAQSGHLHAARFSKPHAE